MKKSKFTGEQIAFALRQAEVGTQVPECSGRWASRRRRITAGSSYTAAWAFRAAQDAPSTSLGFSTPAEFASWAGVNPGP